MCLICNELRPVPGSRKCNCCQHRERPWRAAVFVRDSDGRLVPATVSSNSSDERLEQSYLEEKSHGDPGIVPGNSADDRKSI